MMFKNRKQAAEKLTAKLMPFKHEDMVIYALPRGGVVLGQVIAKALNKPLGLLIVRKIGHPFDPEYAVGTVAEDGHTVFNQDGEHLKNSLTQHIEKERKEAQRRRHMYVKDKTVLAKDKTAVIVDDGIATGLTMELAILEIKHQKPKKIIVAIPVVPKTTAEKLKKIIDELVAIKIDKNYLGAVGAYYESFPQLSDEEVITILTSEKYEGS